MSTFVEQTIRCSCGVEMKVAVARGIHGSRLPLVRQRILAGDFHRFDCESCGRSSIVEVELVYTDFARGQYIAVELPGASLEDAAREHRRIFESAIGPVAGILATPMSMQVVSGRAGLRMALRLAELGYDHRVVADIKREVLETTTLGGPLSVEAADDDGLLLRAADGQTWPVDRAVYNAWAPPG